VDLIAWHFLLFFWHLAKLLIPHDEIEKLVTTLRSDGYQMFRSLSHAKYDLKKTREEIPEVEIHTIHVCDNSEAIGKSISDFDPIEESGLILLAVSRKTKIFGQPDKNFIFQPNDILFFLGKSEKVANVMYIFRDKSCETT